MVVGRTEVLSTAETGAYGRMGFAALPVGMGTGFVKGLTWRLDRRSIRTGLVLGRSNSGLGHWDELN